ncbi:hypothetical protein [Mycolicibacter virginiensis]|uniref:hypothetical protein n=1 Tax=Mycolicibacter virginiensis TaxID=1795032 RepID=UPI001F04CB71|nr:hypothetical protein [Mycolicibacter virginiensis]ULP48049.1 hypothetical protein MJO54_02435 [Mycolicibacter virginiensis]
MTVLNEAQRRLLTFVQAANHGGYSPTPDEVTEWVERPDRKAGKVTRRRVEKPSLPFSSETANAIAGTMKFKLSETVAEMVHRQMSDAMSPVMKQIAGLVNPWSGEARMIEEREPDETLVEQVLRFRWVRTSATGIGLVLTGLGRALLRADADLTTTAEITMLGGDDPLAWGSLVGAIAEVGECVVVDPYLKLEHLLVLAQFTSTTRVIMRRPAKENDLVPWRVCLASPDLNIEMRVADPKLLHDRYIVGDTDVYTLGCSLNGVGRKPTTLAPLSGEVADQVRVIVEEWWEGAEPIGEPPPAEEESEDGDGESDPELGGSVGKKGETP